MRGKSAEQHAAIEGATLAGRPSARARAEHSAPAADGGSGPQAGTGAHAVSMRPTGPSRATPTGTAAGTEHDLAIARALRDDELTRAHGFSGLVALMAFGVLFTLPLLGGDPLAKQLCALALALISFGSAATWYITRPGARTNQTAMRAYGFTIATSVLFVQYYLGFFSPAPVVVTLGVYYFAQSADRVQALWIPIWVCSTYITFSLLTTYEVIEDVGLFGGTNLPLSSHLFALVAVTIVLALTARMSTLSRHSMRQAIERSHEAMLVARKGAALLAEAQQQLERAIGVAIGQPSHYSGQLAGPYRLGVVIGIGAMGEVYEAEHEESGAKAAVKLLRPSALSRADLVERFLREGAICTSLKNPHLVAVYEVGVLGDGAPYMAMERLHGVDLASRLRKDGHLPLADALELSEALASGLEHVHGAGVVHRDLKPVNVFHAEQAGRKHVWKILDFGVSKQRSSTGTLTDVGVVGTPGYMSPEQARGLPVDHRSDIFAMAVVLYRSLTGRPAFTGSDTPQIMFEVVYKMPERPSSVVKGLPQEIDLVLAIALAKDPAQRWSSVRELADALARAAARDVPSETRSRAHAVLRSLPWGQPVPSSGTHDAQHAQRAAPPAKSA